MWKTKNQKKEIGMDRRKRKWFWQMWPKIILQWKALWIVETCLEVLVQIS